MGRVSATGRQQIVNDEGGYRLKAYQDRNGYAIGAGHNGMINGHAITANTTIDRAKAEQLFDADIRKFENMVNSAVKVPISQQWFDALVNFTYINGHIQGTNLIKAINRQDWATATRELSIEPIHEERFKRWRSYVAGRGFGTVAPSGNYSNSSVTPSYSYDYEAIRAENTKTEIALEKNSQLRKDLFDFVNAIDEDDEEPPSISISMKEVDVTGSTSVWGIC